MNVLLFGATGMVGQGVLRECLAAPDVALVQTVGRTATGAESPRLRELVRGDLFDYRDVEARLSGFDACFFCLGVSAAGKSEAEYSRLTHDLALAAGRTLARLNPGMTFVYVSGQGTDASERGRIMWARVKGRTENALRALPFRAVYLFRPGVIQPMHGARSRTPLYRVPYMLLKPFLPLMRWLAPNRVLTTEVVGRAMLAAARRGGPTMVAEIADINALGTAG
ncbi:MAG: NAD(P)H-binding protein [Gemmatimonadota bacterium]|nr:NAD(P)H-binding protein [Gemmatimonadota bacterium]MDE3129290.1 NAD(P)H-binding protein [Gemmatimonadota bacterium]MDE3215511.1 NAD(P)H-binding protein [Gemmatimonadota bacterium]